MDEIGRNEEAAQWRRLAMVSRIEAVTLLVLLFIAVPLKHLAGWPLGVRIMGPVHGLAFCAYLWVLLQSLAGSHWPRGELIRMIILALLPFGGFANAARLTSKLAQH